MIRIYVVAAVAVALAAHALAQDNQGGGRGRLREACGADFQQFCADVPAGGGARLKCLQDHNDKLSDGCKTALTAMQGRHGGQGGDGSKGAAPGSDDQK